MPDDIKILESGDGLHPGDTEYVALSKVNIDFHTGETTSELLGVSPVDIEYNSETPPTQSLSTRNLDFDFSDDSKPEVKRKKRRELIASERGTTYREPRPNKIRPRGGRDRRF